MRWDMVSIKLKHVVRDDDRHGNVRYYFRYAGKKTRLPGRPGESEFIAAYQKALAGVAKPRNTVGVAGDVGTIKWLCERYYASLAWKKLGHMTQARRRSMLDRYCRRSGHLPFSKMEARHVSDDLNALSRTGHAANNLLKSLRGLFRYAETSGQLDRNILRDVRRFETPAGGHHTWTTAEIKQFAERHPLGTKPFLALALLMYTGQRRSDVVRLGKPHIRDGGLEFTQTKNQRKKPVRLWLPILPQLTEAIAACPSKGLTFLETAYGRPFTPAGFGMRFGSWCEEAGLEHCSAHGVRKAAATIAAENGATPHQLMAIFGWSTLDQAELYTKAADQKRISKLSMDLIVPLKSPTAKKKAKSNG